MGISMYAFQYIMDCEDGIRPEEHTLSFFRHLKNFINYLA